MAATAPQPPFIRKLAEYDAEFADMVANVRQKAIYTPGALDVKTKILIAFALDVAHNAEDGILSLSSRARDEGASEEEIAEVLKVAFAVGGMQNLASGVQALK